jgi:hypothetical protein
MTAMLLPLLATVVAPVLFVLWMASPRVPNRLEKVVLAVFASAH